MKILKHLFYDLPYLKQQGKSELAKIAIDIGLVSGKWLEITGVLEGKIQFAEVSATTFSEKMTAYVDKSGNEHGLQYKEILTAITWEMTERVRYDFENEVLRLANAFWTMNPSGEEILKDARFMKEELELARWLIAKNRENKEEDALQEERTSSEELRKTKPKKNSQTTNKISDHLDNEQENDQENTDATDNTTIEAGNKPQTSKQANNQVEEVGGEYRPHLFRAQTSANIGLDPQTRSWAQQVDDEEQLRQAQQQLRNLTISANIGLGGATITETDGHDGNGRPRIQQSRLGTTTNPTMRSGQDQPDLTATPGSNAPMLKNRSNPFEMLEKFGGDRLEEATARLLSEADRIVEYILANAPCDRSSTQQASS